MRSSSTAQRGPSLGFEPSWSPRQRAHERQAALKARTPAREAIRSFLERVDDAVRSRRPIRADGTMLTHIDSALARVFTGVPSANLGRAWMGLAYVASQLGCSTRTAMRSASRLRDAGFIRIDRQGLGRINVYHLLDPLFATGMSHPEVTPLSHPGGASARPHVIQRVLGKDRSSREGWPCIRRMASPQAERAARTVRSDHRLRRHARYRHVGLGLPSGSTVAAVHIRGAGF
jgi:hypothetical protein